MSVAIVTINWNRWRLTRGCIAAVRQSKFSDFHIYVVDNASTDDSLANLRDLGPDVTLIEHFRNSGWSGGNNVGIERALAEGHEYVLLLNNDAQLAPDALGALLKSHAACMSADPKLAPVLGVVERRANGEAGFVRAVTDAATGIPDHVRKVDPAKEPALIPTDFVFGAALFAHRSVFGKVGKFDERFFLNFDETDWCFRARRAGHRLFTVRNAAILHEGSATIGGWGSPLNIYFFVRNRLLFAEKHCTEAQRRNLGQLQSAEAKHYATVDDRLTIAVRRALRDYASRSFGDCPSLIRNLNKVPSGIGRVDPDSALLRPGLQVRARQVVRQIEFSTNPGPFFEPDDEKSPVSVPPAVRLIAYYLPQFHAIPENDAWWGKGFTEWTNVTKAVPRFSGHIQPRLPGELGFYDLSARDILRRQAELAKKYGIFGFCFHHYWFSGTNLLDTPLKLLLDSPDIDLPFCLNWANENWTRRWDGQDDQVLISQKYSAADDLALCDSFLPALRDPRYIRIDGRPLIMIYRPALLPDAAATLERWRKHLRAAGVGDPYLVMPQGFDDHDPRRYGFDAAAGFPPHRFGWKAPVVKPSHPFDAEYEGKVRRYDDMVTLATRARDAEYRLFPGVTPHWDNEARRPNRGATFVGSTPEKYGAWLDHACARALGAENPDERIVFINAWNEWAEGAYLEPDRNFGYAYLAETARALNRIASPPARKAKAKKAVARERVESAGAGIE